MCSSLCAGTDTRAGRRSVRTERHAVRHREENLMLLWRLMRDDEERWHEESCYVIGQGVLLLLWRLGHKKIAMGALLGATAMYTIVIGYQLASVPLLMSKL